MIYFTLVFLQITVVYSAPLQLQLLQPFLQSQQPGVMQLPSQESLMLQHLMPLQHKQEHVPLLQQLLALQQLQTLQRLNMQASVTTHLQRPLLILLPKTKSEQHHLKTDSNSERLKSHHGVINEDADSIIIDAEPNTSEKETQKGILLIPNEGRLGIGDIISGIPFLPIEINVPDSISWIYNGIAGIISGIGQRWPFRPQAENMVQGAEMRNPQMKTMMPILIMPLGQTV
ncbi:hypothetical protein K1T71_004741 [Dendrolimus kikuchii]|uniref:Uncharacterized protein n=1 Tax=Dendrolimus kikuchii TaxID=765133 RepID=A0ACC1D8G8_9NEOP|nr:hypothetical protein K1T71_004741 [Dendrolimus kikuchii]